MNPAVEGGGQPRRIPLSGFWILDGFMLKPVDVAVLLFLCTLDREAPWTQEDVARRLGLSQSQVHRSLRQLERSQLVRDREPVRQAVFELLVHGARYVYPPVPGPPARGLPTAHSAPPLVAEVASKDSLVWPLDEGDAYGPSLEPLHRAIPPAASREPGFHAITALADALRVGRVREREIAARLLAELLGVSA